MPKVLAIQNVSCETVGAIGDVLRGAGIGLETFCSFEKKPLPKEMGSAAGLVIMGGPMGVYEQDRFPFLKQELVLIGEALKGEIPVLGICLGSQLLACALGAEVEPGPEKEIGWFPVTLTDSAKTDPLFEGIPSPFTAYIWHGDVFNLPPGSVSLASSGLTRFQAFRHGKNAYGILFHLEVSGRIVSDMVRAFREELGELNRDGSDILSGAENHLPRLAEIGGRVFSRWAGLVLGRGKSKG